MKFRTKIWMLPLAAAGVFIVGLSSAIVVGHSTQTTLAHLQNVDNPYLESMLRVGRDAEQLRMTLQSAASEGDPGKLDELKPLQADAVKALDTAAALEGKADSAQALRQAFNGWHEAALAATKAMLDKQDFSALLPTMQAKQAEFEKQLAAQEAAARDAQAQSFTAAARGVNRNQWLSGLTGLVVLLVLGITSHRVIVSVWRDIGSEPMELAGAVRRVAEGDLNVHIPVHPKDTRSLSASFAAMTRKLSETVHTIREATDSITTASSEIASGNLDLSARTEQTASNLQSTAGSIEQLTGSVQQSAEVANTANAWPSRPSMRPAAATRSSATWSTACRRSAKPAARSRTSSA
jgi:methyl-accepting chemotaxis protein